MFQIYQKLFPNFNICRKESVEFSRILEAIEIIGKTKISTKFNVLSIGDGSRAQAYHVLNYLKRQQNKLPYISSIYSVDPIINDQYYVEKYMFRQMIEEISKETICKICPPEKPLIIVLQHAHVFVYEILKSFLTHQSVYIVNMQCCKNTKKYGPKPMVEINEPFKDYPKTPCVCQIYYLDNEGIKKWHYDGAEKQSRLLKRKRMYNPLELHRWEKRKKTSKVIEKYHSNVLKCGSVYRIMPNKLLQKIKRSYEMTAAEFRTWCKKIKWEEFINIPIIDEFFMNKSK